MGFRMSPCMSPRMQLFPEELAACVVACAGGSACGWGVVASLDRPRIVTSGWFCGVCGKVAQNDPTCQETGATGACGGDIGWGPSGLHDSGSFGCPGGGGLRLWASIAPGVSVSEWYWPVVGSASSGVGQGGSASQGEWTISGGTQMA